MNKTQNDHNPVAVLESLMVRERADLEQHRTNAVVASEPDMRSLYARLADIHSAIYSELRSLLDELKSRQEITEQINDVYR